MGEPASEDLSRALTAADAGDPEGAAELLELLYEDLRRLAGRRMAREPAGHTLQPTALVHEAYLRLVGGPGGDEIPWSHRGHFFAAAAEAMRRILVERARRYQHLKHGGGRRRLPLRDLPIEVEIEPRDLVDLDAAMKVLARQDPRMYDGVMLRFFAGLSVDQTAELLETSPSTIDREWRCARIWMYKAVKSGAGDTNDA